MSLNKLWLHLSPKQRFSLLASAIFLLALPIAVLNTREQKLVGSRAFLPYPHPPPKFGNLVVNPSFETDTNTDLIPDYWTWSKIPANKNSRQVCTLAQDGQCSFLIKGGKSGQTLSQDISLPYDLLSSKSQGFSFSAWSKALKANKTGPYQAELIFLDKEGKQLASETIPFPPGTYDFSLAAQKIPLPSSSPATARIILRYDKPGGQVWFDNIHLSLIIPVSPTPPPPPPPPRSLPDLRINSVYKNQTDDELHVEVCNDGSVGIVDQFDVTLSNPASTRKQTPWSFSAESYSANYCANVALTCNVMGDVCNWDGIVARADAENQIVESNELNNTYTVYFPVSELP